MGKEFTETWVRSLGWEDPLEKGKATHSSILTWRIPWTVLVPGVAKSRTRLSDFHFTSLHFPLVTKQQHIWKIVNESEYRGNVDLRNCLFLSHLSKTYTTLVIYDTDSVSQNCGRFWTEIDKDYWAESMENYILSIAYPSGIFDFVGLGLSLSLSYSEMTDSCLEICKSPLSVGGTVGSHT